MGHGPFSAQLSCTEHELDVHKTPDTVFTTPLRNSRPNDKAVIRQ